MKKYSLKEGIKKNIYKKISFISALLIIVQLILGGSMFTVGLENAQAAISGGGGGGNLCSTDVDIVLTMDRSGSMASGQVTENCVWWEIVSNGIGGYEWVQNTTYNVDQAWCDAKSQPPSRLSVYTPASLSKMEMAKNAANSFLNLMGTNDQSGLVYFSYDETPADPNNDPWIAFLDKTLSSDHGLTSTHVDALTPDGPTNIGDAIDLANKELASSRANSQAVKAMILLTDGVPNMPSDTGNNNSLDVQYALDRAGESATQNIKVFTIGLGDEINTNLLTDIANLTGAKYYPSPSSNDLEEIYNSIALDLCQYGSITGCKYNDENNDASSNGIDSTEPKLDDWEIVLDDGSATTSQLTVNGCYSFAGLESGIYTISEVLTGDWVQTYPVNGSHSVIISNSKNAVNIDFANFLPSVPATSTISGYKYNDLNNNGLIDDGGAIVSDWEIQLVGCPYSPLSASELTFVDKSSIATGTSPLPGQCTVISTTTTDNLGYYEFIDLTAGDYGVSEVDVASWTQTLPANNQFYYFNLKSGVATTTIDFANYKLAETTACGDGVIQTPNSTGFDEQCDDGNLINGDGCSDICTTESGGGGGTLCGDGITQKPNSKGFDEQCDDGNTASGDGCSSTCSIESSGSGASSGGGGGGGTFCGDGTVQLPNSYGTYEECDGSSGLPSGKTCSASCKIVPLASGSSSSGNNDDVVVLGEEGAPVLEITKTVTPNKVKPGDEVEYTVIVKNIGNITAFDAEMKDSLLDDLEYVDGGGNEKTWSLGDIAPGAEVETKFKVKVSLDAHAGILTNSSVALATNHGEVEDTADIEVEEVVVLAASGFSLIEFSLLMSIVMLLAGVSQILKRRETKV